MRAAGVGVTLTLLMLEMLLMLGNGFVTPDIAIANCLHKLLTVQIMAHAPTQMHNADAPENRFLEQKMCQVFLLKKKKIVWKCRLTTRTAGLFLR